MPIKIIKDMLYVYSHDSNLQIMSVIYHELQMTLACFMYHVFHLSIGK